MSSLLKYIFSSWLITSLVFAIPAWADEKTTSESDQVVSTPPAEDKDTDQDDTLDQLRANQDELKTRQDELSKINAQINELAGLRDTAKGQADLASNQLAGINNQLQITELALEQTSLAITVTNADIDEVVSEIRATEEDMDRTKDRLSNTIRMLHKHENTPILSVIFGSDTLGGLLAERRTYHALHDSALDLINELRTHQESLDEQHQNLVEQQDSLQQLKESQSYQQVDLSSQKTEKNRFLKMQQAEQAKYDQQIAEARQARSEIEQSLFKLQALGLEIGLQDAFAAAQYAADLTGVSPALILGIVKIETNVGANVGSGKFPDDMHPGSREAFIRLTKKLKLDPYETPISRRPTSYQGWGGAMGPGQIMPATWEHLESRISSLTGNPTPSPFELVDSLVGVGIMMADRGAANPGQHIEAVGRYLAGPNWQYHMWYVNKVLAVAAEYEKEF